jgi:hypothetical protein
LEEEFRAELEEKQHFIAALNTKVGPGSNRYTLGGGGRGVQGSKFALEEEFRRRTSTSLQPSTPK